MIAGTGDPLICRDEVRREGLYRFKTHRMVFELGIHEISYAAW
jgi:hypothetical protein